MVFGRLDNATRESFEENEAISLLCDDSIDQLISALLEIKYFDSKFLYSIDDMLLKCKFNGEECSKNDFTTFNSERFGTCYSFNAKTQRIF